MLNEIKKFVGQLDHWVKSATTGDKILYAVITLLLLMLLAWVISLLVGWLEIITPFVMLIVGWFAIKKLEEWGNTPSTINQSNSLRFFEYYEIVLVCLYKASTSIADIWGLKKPISLDDLRSIDYYNQVPTEQLPFCILKSDSTLFTDTEVENIRIATNRYLQKEFCRNKLKFDVRVKGLFVDWISDYGDRLELTVIAITDDNYQSIMEYEKELKLRNRQTYSTQNPQDDEF